MGMVELFAEDADSHRGGSIFHRVRRNRHSDRNSPNVTCKAACDASIRLTCNSTAKHVCCGMDQRLCRRRHSGHTICHWCNQDMVSQDPTANVDTARPHLCADMDV